MPHSLSSIVADTSSMGALFVVVAELLLRFKNIVPMTTIKINPTNEAMSILFFFPSVTPFCTMPPSKRML
jgi:hypothetical protein